jgi:hypothetical protein
MILKRTFGKNNFGVCLFLNRTTSIGGDYRVIVKIDVTIGFRPQSGMPETGAGRTSSR